MYSKQEFKNLESMILSHDPRDMKMACGIIEHNLDLFKEMLLDKEYFEVALHIFELIDWKKCSLKNIHEWYFNEKTPCLPDFQVRLIQANYSYS